MPNSQAARHLSDRDLQVTNEAVLAAGSASTFQGLPDPRLVWINEYRKLLSPSPEVKWQSEIFPAVRRYLELPRGWDSYGGQPLKLETGMFALKILNDIMGVRTPIPHSVPISTGGIQFEWHENDFDLELTVSGPFDCDLWYHDHRTNESGSLHLLADLSPLIAQIARLTRIG
jgi:hypothetical protein